MGFDFGKVSGEQFGDIKDVFFKKDGKSILPQSQSTHENISVSDLTKDIANTANTLSNKSKTGNGQTVINISKDLLGEEDDLRVILTQLEEKRRNTSSVRNKHFIDINTGEEVVIIDQNEMYNGTSLLIAKHENEKVITYPRSMFVGRTKKFVPKDFYIREAERSIEDTIDKFGHEIMEMVKDASILSETSDGKYIEVVLDTPMEIIGGMQIPDKIQIPVKRMFDMEYKLMMLENVICLDNKIAALLFIDIWF